MKSLRNALLINGISSGATGLILVAAPSFVANIVDATTTAPILAVGFFLIAFAGLVLYSAKPDNMTRKLVNVITFLDITWVVVSLFIAATRAFALSGVGYLLIVAVALWVALMAVLQLIGVKRIAN